MHRRGRKDSNLNDEASSVPYVVVSDEFHSSHEWVLS